MLSWGMGSPQAGEVKGGLFMCKGNPGVLTETPPWFQTSDYKIQPRIQKIYLLLFLRMFIVGELEPIEEINSRDRKTQNPGHT